ncbi:glycosyl transferase family 2 [Vulcanibacillus modesticaldus]|uniref:Glycosyl transferase family 2 n=1 Tax=Vulcanibacillus modesticaldus TaxID=337097 RepID=A0A1D2YS72_9BACI|nr:glycosyltransferase family 2 protein [Vulcanibacillus modesticaldus]OEF96913.1 glycosyl transferase family 2 [Vulcanibacillus modesticaldus]
MKQQRIIVFLPAHNEEESIAEVLKQIPRNFDPRVEVKVLVVDDGSTDNTVEKAKEAGADYIYSFSKNRGLGAAVRMGLAEALRLRADIAVYIDSDNEYPAWQIPEVIAPILAGEADYVMGSRFLGTISGMKLYRRLGNYFFTFLQSIILRKRIYDGQSGMRAFSKQAMEHAEIIHDYNYAQVLTLNLVRKGFRLKEVPITYQVRKKGKSFINFNYIFKVIPAIIKEIRRPVTKVEVNKNAHLLKKNYN